MNIKKIAAAFLTALFFITSMQAQENSSEQTIEDVYLKSTVKAQIIRSQAESPDRDMKLIAIQDIGEMINNGEVNENSIEIIDILGDLSAEGIDKRVVEGGRVINNFSMVRKEAVRILGEIGGENARNSILEIFKNENETMVLTEAVLALSKAGIDEDGEVLDLISWTMHSQTAVNKDNTFANASLSAIQKLAKDNEGLDDEKLFREIAAIADPRNGYITVVRMKALQLLDELQSYY
ncbi:MAG: HEAT repeat domain-containing protein [Spirochaetaceae bacterium]|nr:HEAT repeat domain-containing protein [Spirochaetaceae bacterium]